MLGEKREHWRDLCEQAAVEQDSEKLLELTQEINRLLEEKEKRLAEARKAQSVLARTDPTTLEAS